MSARTIVSNGGTGVAGLLGVVFVTLKLTGFIGWSWWWVTAPFWGSFAVAAFFFLVFVVGSLLLMLLALLFGRVKKWRRR